MPRFVRAFERAKQIASEVFEPSKSVFGIVASTATTDGFEALRQAGFASAPMSEWHAPLWPEEQESTDQVPALWRAFDLTDDTPARDVLIWCQIAREMAVSPTAPVMSYLADYERGITLYVYDDRGMDLTAAERGPLLGLYTSRTNWLLEYDRARMKQAFE